MRPLTLGFAAALALCVATSATAEPEAAKPDIVIEMKQGEITVTMDERIKANPPLAANVLAEGKSWAGKQRTEVQAALKSDPSVFKPDMPWSFERSYVTEAVVGRYASIVYNDYTFTGGAHPNHHIDTILWDGQTRKRVSVRPFFKETEDNGPTMTALLGLVRKGIDAEKKEREGDSAPTEPFTGLEAKLLGIGPISLAASTEPNKSSGLVFNYEPYAVGAYAEGAFFIFVPWRSFASHLSPEGAAIFGGDEPKEDATPN